VVLPAYSAEEICKALAIFRDPAARIPMARNAKRCGGAAMNWEKGEQVLNREYAALLSVSPRESRTDDPRAVSSEAGAR
jgi:hypothetical protein